MLLSSNIPISFFLKKVKYELPIVSVYAFGIAFLDEFVHLQNISIPITLPALLGTSISLILAFRINQSYDRWWEARKIWGAIVNDSRSLVRQLLFLPSTNETNQLQEFQHKMANRQIAWCFALGESLRGFDPHKDQSNYLSQEDIAFLKKHQNVPNGLLVLLGKGIREAKQKGWIDSYQEVQLDRTLVNLTDHMGKCERIKNTVFPVTYSLFVEFFLAVFVMLLPFGIIDYFGFMVAPVIVAISIPFFLLEKAAIYLQDPFQNQPTDTPVTTIARTIAANINEMLDEHHEGTVEKLQGKYYIM